MFQLSVTTKTAPTPTATALKNTAAQQQQPKVATATAAVTNKVTTPKTIPPAAPAKRGLKATPPVMTKTQNVAPVSTMRTRSHGDVDTSADEFLINQPCRQLNKLKVDIRKKLTKRQRILNRIAQSPRQKKVSDFYYVDPSNIDNVSYLPDLVRSDVPPPICVTISDDSELEGPNHVSSPSSQTQVFHYPNLSPINHDDSIIVVD